MDAEDRYLERLRQRVDALIAGNYPGGDSYAAPVLEADEADDPVYNFFSALRWYVWALASEAVEIRSAHRALVAEMRGMREGARAMQARYTGTYCRACAGYTIEQGDQLLYTPRLGAVHANPEVCVSRVQRRDYTTMYSRGRTAKWKDLIEEWDDD